MDDGTSLSLDHLLAQYAHSPSGMSERPQLQCCCGHPQCAFLTRNLSVLDELETKVHQAGQVGRALLERHDAHLEESQRERFRMTTMIERLETDKKELEILNARKIEENRNLLDQLEELNNTVLDSDSQIQSLTATLYSTRQEIQRLTSLAGRATQLETQLAYMELEQQRLHSQADTTEASNRTLKQRWKQAEGTIGQLQGQIDRMEKEAQEERERHMEVLHRMERRKTVETELELSASPSKSSILAQARDPSGGSVVSHFVKDILQDNANLQLGIVELREMLLGSNAEIESLREELQLHQPMADAEASRPTLGAELGREPLAEHTPGYVPELHVHHHYHAPEKTAKKPRRKHAAPANGHFLPSSGTSTPNLRRPREWRATPPSSAATILSHTSVTVPPVNRWSVQSSATESSLTPSSMSGSPHRASSIFDSLDTAFDSTRPTTPESSVASTPGPIFRGDKTHRSTKRAAALRRTSASSQMSLGLGLEGSILNGETIDVDDQELLYDSDLANAAVVPSKSQYQKHTDRPRAAKSASFSTQLATALYEHDTIPEEEDDGHDEDQQFTTPSIAEQLAPRARLRRMASHDSLLSISGMDIHTLQGRPSQTINARGLYSVLTPKTSAPSSSKPTISQATAIVTPSYRRHVQDSSEFTRNLLSQTRGAPDGRSNNSLGRLVGGWVLGKWSGTPDGGTECPKPKAASSNPVPAAAIRTPGVNQPGPIRGLRQPASKPSNVEAAQVDENLLQESLRES